VALLLQRSGYTNFKVLKGGFDAWKSAGGATEK
jgi:rhodanese-related sulfurtransferase